MPDYSHLPIVPSSGGNDDYSSLPSSGGALSRLDESFLGRLKNNLVAAADAASFGFADEGAAALRSVLPGFKDYDSELAAIRGRMKDYSEVHPYQSLASSLVGGAAPIVAAEVASGGAATPAVVPSLSRAVGQGAKAGATYGGLYGFGSGEGGLQSRAVNSLVQSLLGAGFGGALGGAGYGAGKTWAAIKDVPSAFSTEEAGAILPNVTRETPEAVPAEYRILARRLSSIPEERLVQGQQALSEAAAEDSPMFLPESVDSPSVQRLGRFLAGNESSMDVMQGAVNARKAGALERVSGILDEISPERSQTTAGESVQTAIKGVQTALEKKRSAEASPLYQKLRESGPFKSAEVSDIAQNERVQDAIKQVRRIFPEYKDQPDLSFDILDKAKQWLDGESSSTTNKAERRFINEVRSKLVGAMDAEKEGYKAARGVYEEGSTTLNQLFGDKGKPMVDILKRKPEDVGKSLLGIDYTKRLPELVNAIGPDGEQALRDSVRAALQGKIELKRETADLVSDIVRVPAMRERIRGVLGDETKFNRLMKLLGREETYARGNNAYFPGSTTHGNFQEERILGESLGKLTSAMKAVKNPVQAVDKWLMSRTLPDETARRLATILTDPQEGQAFYEKMLPWIIEQQRAASIGGKVGALTGDIAGTSAPIINPLTKKPQ